MVHNDVYPDLVPLSQAVYAGYRVHFGMALEETWPIDPNDPNNLEFKMALANMFIYGAKIGRISTDTAAYLDNLNIYGAKLSLTRDIIKWKYVLRDYLQYGRMLRPPVDDLLPLEQLEDWTHRSGTWSSTLESSAIMSGVWEATDGNTAVVLFNISDAEQDYEYELSSDDYDVLINGADLYNLTIDGSKSYIDDVNSVFTLSDTLESGEVKVFLLE